MNIAINALSIKIGGGVTYIKNIIPNLLAEDKENVYYVFIPEGMGTILPDAAKTNGKLKIIEMRSRNIISRMLIEQFVIPFLVRKYRIDLLYCPANILSLFANCKKILQVQSIDPFVSLADDPWRFRVRNLILRTLSRRSIKAADAVIFLSLYSRDLVLSSISIDRSRVKQIYLAVNPAGDQAAAKPGKYILSVSNITRRKHFEVLIRAFGLMKENLKNDYQLLIAGEAKGRDALAYYNELLALVKQQGLEGKVSFAGKVGPKEIVPLYRNAALFVLPSLVENFSFTPLEAMAAGVPVVVANTTGNPEAVGEAGLLFDPPDPANLRDIMEKLLDNNELRKTLSAKGRDWVKRFSWQKSAAELLKVFREQEQQ